MKEGRGAKNEGKERKGEMVMNEGRKGRRLKGGTKNEGIDRRKRMIEE